MMGRERHMSSSGSYSLLLLLFFHITSRCNVFSHALKPPPQVYYPGRTDFSTSLQRSREAPPQLHANTNDPFRIESQIKQEMYHWNCNTAPNSSQKPPRNSNTGSTRCCGIRVNTSQGHSNLEKHSRLNSAPAYSGGEEGSNWPHCASTVRNCEEPRFFTYFYQLHTYLLTRGAYSFHVAQNVQETGCISSNCMLPTL